MYLGGSKGQSPMVPRVWWGDRRINIIIMKCDRLIQKNTDPWNSTKQHVPVPTHFVIKQNVAPFKSQTPQAILHTGKQASVGFADSRGDLWGPREETGSNSDTKHLSVLEHVASYPTAPTTFRRCFPRMRCREGKGGRSVGGRAGAGGLREGRGMERLSPSRTAV